MKAGWYIGIAVVLILLVSGVYFVHFFIVLDYSLSNDPSRWSDLGGYFGGVLAPLLTFVSIILLIKSLTLQIDANKSLSLEVDLLKKSERFKAFETQFFAMLGSQRDMFQYVEFVFEDESQDVIRGVESIRLLEDKIESMQEDGRDEVAIKEYLLDLDRKELIFNLVRCFYLIVKMVSNKLSESNGFTREDRLEHYLTAINFTDFSNLRLILISIRFLEFQSTKYLRSHKELMEVFRSVGLDSDVY